MNEDCFGPRMLLRDCPARVRIGAYAEEMGWSIVSEVGDTGSGENLQLVIAVAPGFLVNYVEDFVSRQCYMYVSGSEAFATQRLALQVAGDLDPWALGELLDDVDQAPDPLTLGQRIVRLGIGAPYDFDETVFRKISEGMQHADARVRRLSMLACGYSPWLEYLPFLAEIAEADVDESLRERAMVILDTFDTHGIRQS